MFFPPLLVFIIYFIIYSIYSYKFEWDCCDCETLKGECVHLLSPLVVLLM